MVFEKMRVKEVEAVLHYTPNRKRWKAEKRRNHIVGIVLGGSAYHDLGYQSFTLSEGCVYFFNQRDDYDVTVFEPGDAFSVHFTTFGEIETDSFCVPVKNPDEIITLLSRLESIICSSDRGELELLSALYKLLGAVSETRQTEYFRRDARISAAKSYIDEHFREEGCLRAATAESGLSARRFGELFKGLFGATPNRYIVQRKIEYAKAMLETKSLSVVEVSEKCGFSDVSYFSKVFKEICGVPPSRWH